MNGVSLKLGLAATDERDWLQQPIEIRRTAATRHAVREELGVSRRLTGEPANCRCPHCDSIIYSRRHKLCGLCGRELPEEFLFSQAEAQRLEDLIRTEQERHRRWMRKGSTGALSG